MLHISASLWMVLPLESSRTLSRLAFHSQRSSPWGYTLASGTQTIGQQEEGLWRQIGHKLPLLHHIGTSMPKHVYGLLGHLLVVQSLHLQELPTIIHGWKKIWIPQAKPGWSGCRKITWFITTAQTPNASHRAFLQSVPLPMHRRDESNYKIT